MGRRHDRRQSDQRAQRNLEGNARPRPSVARAGQRIDRKLDRRPRARPRDAHARRGLEAGNPRQSAVHRAGAGALREDLETALLDDLPRHAEAIVRWLAVSASALGRWLEEDAARRARINRRLRLLALRTVLPRRAEIGAY